MKHYIKKLKEEYINDSDVCMDEFLSSINPPSNLSIADCFELYITLMKWADGDKFYVVKDNKQIEL